jgi:hypothetical protein
MGFNCATKVFGNKIRFLQFNRKERKGMRKERRIFHGYTIIAYPAKTLKTLFPNITLVASTTTHHPITLFTLLRRKKLKKIRLIRFGIRG